MTHSKQAWSDYWQEGRADGEVFVDAAGRRHPALASYWQSVFETLPDGIRVIDIASGAGSVFGHLPAGHAHDLTAADLSAEALALLKKRTPGAQTIACSANAIPCPDQSFDLVASQFGVEYAGVDAFSEAARLVAPKGRLRILAHIEDGFIDAPNKAQLAAARLVAETGFIDRAVAIVTAVFEADEAAIARAERSFVPAARQLEAALQRCPEGVHAHLYQGFRQLYERRSRYLLGDIIGWLEDMRGEVDKVQIRLSEMRRAAMSTHDVQSISGQFHDAGLDSITIERFVSPQHSLPLAWDIRAERPE